MPQATEIKLTLDDFKKKLKEGGYSEITGARKAIGRVNGWTDKQRDAARAVANEHFGVTGDEPKKPKAKATAKKTGAKRGPKPGSKRGRKPKAEKVEAAAPTETAAPEKKGPGRGRKPKAETSTRPSISSADYSHVTEAVENLKSSLVNVNLARDLGASSEQIAQNAELHNKALALCAMEVVGVLRKSSVNPNDPNFDQFSKHVLATSVSSVPGQVVNGPPPPVVAPTGGFSMPTFPMQPPTQQG